MTAARAIVPVTRVPRALQRACTCGRPAKDGGECVECKRKRASVVQRHAASGAGFGASFAATPAGRPRLPVNDPHDAFEREADAMADAVLAGRSVAAALAAPARVQREGAGIIPAGPLDLGDTSAARNRKLPERRPGTPHGTSENLDPSPEPCLRGARCQLAIAGSNMDFADAAHAAESKSRAELKQKGESVKPRPAPEMTRFLRTSAASAARWIREVLVDPSMGGGGGAGAWHGPCPDDAKAACITVAAAWEDEAREFNTKPDAAEIGGQPRAEWRFVTLQMMSHEAAHERFDRAPPAGTPAFTGFRHRSSLSHKELGELFAQLSEFPVFYGEHMTGDDPAPEKLRRLRDDYGARYLVQGEEISENIPGIVMRLRCLNPCAEVDAMLRANFASASAGWPPAVRQALLTLLTDPAYGMNWPAPRQPAWSVRPEPEGLRFGSNQLQREAAGPQAAPVEAPPVVHDVLRSCGAPLDTAARAELEPRFGHDFSGVRVHTDGRAAASARAVQATAYTVGRDIVFDRGAYAPHSAAGRRLLAHELAHVVQQGGSPRAVQRDLVAPNRLATVHSKLFSTAAGSSSPRQPWKNASGGDKGTAGMIYEQAVKAITKHVKDNPGSVSGVVPSFTDETDVDADAVTVDGRLRARFPQITTAVNEAHLKKAVGIMTPELTKSKDFLHAWLANRLIDWTDIELHEIGEKDPRFVAVMDDLLATMNVGGWIRTMASRVGGYQTGEGAQREVFIHRGAKDLERRAVLVHELAHLHMHAKFRAWVDATTDPRFFNEGITEWLARQVMTAKELGLRTSYADRVKAVEQDLAAHVPPDDIARAYFAGEVWRLEGGSAVSQREFAAQAGIPAGAKLAAENTASRSGPGLNQEVMPGRHYRFFNLGHDQPAPKPEHVAYFGGLKTRVLDSSPADTVRFEGHAAGSEPPARVRVLSLKRAIEFYQMARNAGLPEARLVDAAKPAHFGKDRPTLAEKGAETRAFNRRVELFIQPAAGGAVQAPANEKSPPVSP